MAERLCRHVNEAALRDLGIPAPTISIGFTLPRPGESIDATLLRADEALYMAKAAGRNCCRGLEPPPLDTAARFP